MDGGDQVHGVDLLADVDGDDVGALLRQPHRVRAALTARRAGDESDLAFDTSGHCYLNSSLVERISPKTAGIESQPRTVDVGDERRVGQVDIPFGEALEDLLQRDAALQPGQRRAQAVVGADTEGQVLAVLAVDVENVAVGRELAVVAVGRADEHHHHAALGHRLAVVLDVAGDVAGHVRRGRLEAQQLLDGLRDQRRVLDELAALVGVFGQNLAGPADQPRGGLVARAGDHVEVDEQFLAGQPPRDARLVDELDVEQFGHDVVGRVLGAPVDVGREELAGDQPVLGGLHRLARLGAHLRVGVVADHLLVVLGDAEQHADHLHRHLRAEVGDEVEPAGADQRIQALRAEFADLGLQRVDLARGEHPRQQLAVDVVDRRVLENQLRRAGSRCWP